MNKKKKISMVIILCCLFFMMIDSTSAECDDKEIALLREQVKNVSIEYEHVEDLYSEEFDLKIVNLFNIYVYGLNDKFILRDVNNKRIYTVEDLSDGMLKFEYVDGGTSLKYEILSSECDTKIKSITLKLPFYNSFSENEKCKEYKEAKVCSKFLNYELTKEKFDSEIQKYIDDLNEKKQEDNLFNKIINVISENLIYIIFGIVLVTFAAIGIIVYKKRRELK